MKTKKIKFILLFCFTIFFTSCEKNDLCDGIDVETPRLYIDFKDQFDVSQLKSVPYIEARILGESKQLEFTATNKILLPLKPGISQTTWTLSVYNNATENKQLIGTDTLKFTYLPQNIFISRACGYKTNFSSFSFQRTPQNNSWIKGINLIKTTITNEESAHIEFYH